MKQQTKQTTERRARKSSKSRVATRDLVTIGQCWEERTRRKTKLRVRIRQVHRADRQVEAIVLGVGVEADGRAPMVRIRFTDLRNKYKLIKKEST